MKNIKSLSIEALIVGLVAILFYLVINKITVYFNIDNIYLDIFLVGSLIHLIFEFTGLNKYYVDNYYK